MANRHKARESALEILYAWSSAGYDAGMIADLLSDRMRIKNRRDQDVQFLRESVMGVTEHLSSLDEAISGAVKGRSLASMGHIELNALRLAVWEMGHRPETPCRVVINEALELTRTYADETARSFVNGVVDRLARSLRAEELKTGAS